jgi:hypothetical protein
MPSLTRHAPLAEHVCALAHEEGHVLASARVVGHYTLNPDLPECQIDDH